MQKIERRKYRHEMHALDSLTQELKTLNIGQKQRVDDIIERIVNKHIGSDRNTSKQNNYKKK